MIKILFICHGNICRSPMGEFILKDMVQKVGVAQQFEIASKAVSREEIGNPVYSLARRELEMHGISCAGKRAGQVTQEDLDYYDRIYCMDASNGRYLRRMFFDCSKCRPLLERDVAEPWYAGDIKRTWEDILEGCQRIMEEFT